MPPSVAVLGEALVDLAPIEVDGEPGFVVKPGGSPFNVCIALSRLGVPTRFLGRLSQDDFGQLLRRRLEQDGVDTTETPTGHQPTAVALVTVDPEGRPSYRFLWDGTADRMLRAAELPSDLGDAAAIHVGSVSRVLQPGAAAIDELVARERPNRLISYDPNVRPQLVGDPTVGRQRIEDQAATAHLVKVSNEDLRWVDPGSPIEDTARRWLGLGPSLVVVTQGALGAIAMTRTAMADVPGVPVDVQDTVGAGDAFTAGLLAALHRQGRLHVAALERMTSSDLVSVLTAATHVAAITCSRRGADPPHRSDLGGGSSL